MNAKEILQKYLDVDNTPMKGNEWIIDCMTEYAESLTPKWQPIEELINLEYGVWVVVKERERRLIAYDIHQITQWTPRETMQRFYSHFLMLPNP